MRYINETTDFQLHNSVVTLGKFDGLHIGHQMLLNQVLELKQKGFQSVMFTFSLHPYNLFSERELRLIYTNHEKYYHLKQMGFDVLISYPFTKHTADINPKDFIKKVLVEQLDAKVVVVGEDFCFGKHRKGNVDLLKELALEYGYKVYSHPKLTSNNQVVSSTRVRDELLKGNMEEVQTLLGRPFSIRGEVIHGRRLGRTFGMPTINIQPPEEKLLPPNGVYGSTIIIDDIKRYGVTNIGFKPTVGSEPRPGVETYILDYTGDLYGQEVEVNLHHYMRSELKFDTIEQLKEQMQRDMEYAIQYFNRDVSPTDYK